MSLSDDVAYFVFITVGGDKLPEFYELRESFSSSAAHRVVKTSYTCNLLTLLQNALRVAGGKERGKKETIDDCCENKERILGKFWKIRVMIAYREKLCAIWFYRCKGHCSVDVTRSQAGSKSQLRRVFLRWWIVWEKCLRREEEEERIRCEFSYFSFFSISFFKCEWNLVAICYNSLKIDLLLYRNRRNLPRISVILIDVNCTIFNSTRLEIGIRALKRV